MTAIKCESCKYAVEVDESGRILLCDNPHLPSFGKNVKHDRFYSCEHGISSMTLDEEYDATCDEQLNVQPKVGSHVLFEIENVIKAGVVVEIDKSFEYMTPPSDIYIVRLDDGTEKAIHEDEPIIVRKGW